MNEPETDCGHGVDDSAVSSFTSAKLGLLCRTLYPVAQSLLWDRVVLTETDEPWRIAKFMKLYTAIRKRDPMGTNSACLRLAVAPYCLASLVGQDAAHLLMNDILLHLRPQELYWQCGDISPYIIQTYSPYLAPTLVKLHVGVHTGANLRQLANLLAVSPQTLKDLIVRFHTPLYEPMSPEEARLNFKCPLWESAEEEGYGICPLPKLEHLFLLNLWTEEEYEEGENITMQNLLHSIMDDCVLQVRDKSPRYIGHPPWVPVWQKRLDANRSVPLENGNIRQESVKYYIPIE